MKRNEIDRPIQHAWNAASIIVYAALFVILGYGIHKDGQNIEDLKVRDILILILATYRLTRIVVFEKIFKLFRDFVKSNAENTVLNTVKAIITCPWCAGVWVALIVVAFYFLVPYGKLFIFLLAISGVATFIVLLSNLLSLKIDKEQSALRDNENK